jgi:hypothetical protein
MTGRHEVPTHLDAPDRFLFGLTAKQAMQLMAAAAGTYGMLNNEVLAPEVRLPIAILSAIFGVVAALVRPGGRALEEWAILLVSYHLSPRTMVWRPCAIVEDERCPSWVELSPRIGWTAPLEDAAHVR